MKRRIIGLILVVVMLTLSLASCGFSMLDEDLTQYADFNADAVKNALLNLKIEDADFTNKEETRQLKVMDSIYEALAKEIDTKDEDSRVTAGVVGARDLLLYCYYVTATYTEKVNNADVDKSVILYASTMSASKAVELHLGHSDNEDVAALIEEKLENYDLTDKAYKTVTSGKTATVAGKLAFVSYTEVITDADNKTKTNKYTNHLITLGEEGGDIGKKLVGSEIGKAVEDFKSEDGKVSYTSAKVDWVVESGAEISFEYDVDAKSTTTTKDTLGNTRKLVEAKDKKLTYHVYPVYYYEVEDYNASSVLRTLIATLSTSSLECLKECEAEIKAFNEKLSAYNTAETEYQTAVEAEEKAKTALDAAQLAYDTENQKADKDAAKLEAYLKTLNKAKADYQGEDGNGGAKKAAADKLAAKNTAETELNTAEKAVEEYKESVYDDLLEKYNEDIKALLAKVVWAVLESEIKTTGAPEKAVEETYDRLMESYKYTFYNGKYDSSETNYNHYDGNFKEFMIKKTGKSNYTDAKHAVWAEAVAHVKTIIVVYASADCFGQLADEDEIKEYKKGEDGYYEAYEASYGELNTLAAYQFDKLMNYLLDYETDDNGEAKYDETVIKYTIKADEAE